MPTISMFYGIPVFDSEKCNLPHVHVRYNEFKTSDYYLEAIFENGKRRWLDTKPLDKTQ